MLRLRKTILFCAVLMFTAVGIAGADLIKEAREREAQKKVPKREVAFPAGSMIKHSNSGKVSAVTLSDSYECQGVIWPYGSMLEFDEAGKLRWVSINSPVTIEGVTWPNSCEIEFTQTGKINQVYINDDCVIQDKAYKMFNKLKVDSKGQVIKISDY